MFEKISLVNSNENPAEMRARAAAERISELLVKLESMRDYKQKFREARSLPRRSLSIDPMREGYYQQLLRARAILVETMDSLDEDEARLSYQKLVVDCDPYLKDADKSQQV